MDHTRDGGQNGLQRRIASGHSKQCGKDHSEFTARQRCGAKAVKGIAGLHACFMALTDALAKPALAHHHAILTAAGG
jgi:hypothetical protein